MQMLKKIRSIKAFELIRLMRVSHYIKNILIFVPLIFSYGIFNKVYFSKVFMGGCCFSFMNSTVYIINDLMDMEEDKNHPIKKWRPLACGALKKKDAYILSFVLTVLSLCGSVIFWSDGGYVVIIYFILNVIYSRWLKHYPIYDIMCLSLFFMIRIWFGCLLIGVQMSNWLYLTALAFSMYMSVGKRCGEIKGECKQSGIVRKSLKGYTYGYLNSIRDIFLALQIIFYSLWSTSDELYERFGSDGLKYSAVLLIILLLRYHLLIFNSENTDPTNVFYQDKSLMVMALLYAVYIMFCINGLC